MINIKNPAEIKIMREVNRIVGRILKAVSKEAAPE